MKKRYKHSLSNYKLLTCDMGQLVPCGITEVMPGDTVQQATSLLMRVSPLNTPVMHPTHARIHHWFVPFRLIWEDFEDFITGGPTGNSTPLFPTITTPASTGFAVGSLADYLGVPTGVPDEEISALPFRAYAKIFNENYRDQDLVDPLDIDETSGPDTTTNTTLQNCAWEKDYFTSARPFTQKGPTILVPVTGQAPVERDTDSTNSALVRVAATGGLAGTVGLQSSNTGNFEGTSGTDFQLDPNGTMMANLSEGTGSILVSDLRRSMALQRFEEMRARYGSRYTEYLRSAFGVRSSDARLQRPEYLGGGKQTLQFSEILQTAPDATTGTTASTGVGKLRGHGIGALRSNRYRRFFEEHGYVISLLSVKPTTMYTQGLARHWNKRTKYDYYQHELAHIGQQEVKYKELYLAHATPEEDFGYQDRYDEYRRIESSIAGEFRTTLNTWHYGRIFASDPELNDDFVTANPTNRVYQSTSTNQLLIMAHHSIQARRPVPRSAKSFIY